MELLAPKGQQGLRKTDPALKLNTKTKKQKKMKITIFPINSNL